ncbi:hypothetical protein Scep_010679 [Stephania cephalantha]|uniref:Uncharacterized protein n=1 Tax=Stephania cephalantha TaxID=152367 RepID=A0AAP0JVI8_9MAGN
MTEERRELRRDDQRLRADGTAARGRTGGRGGSARKRLANARSGVSRRRTVAPARWTGGSGARSCSCTGGARQRRQRRQPAAAPRAAAAARGPATTPAAEKKRKEEKEKEIGSGAGGRVGETAATPARQR